MIEKLRKLDSEKKILAKCTCAFVVKVVLLLCLGTMAKCFDWKIEESLGVITTVLLLVGSTVLGGIAILLSDMGTWLHNEIAQFRMSTNIK